MEKENYPRVSVFKDIKKIFRESFFTVLFLTIIFNSLYFLVLKNIATKFTFFIIFALMGLVISTIAYKVHRDILLNQTVFNPLIKMFDLSGFAAGVLLIQCSMPSAILTYLIASMYSPKEIVDNIASMIVVSTLMSLVTVPIIVFIALKYFS